MITFFGRRALRFIFLIIIPFSIPNFEVKNEFLPVEEVIKLTQLTQS